VIDPFDDWLLFGLFLAALIGVCIAPRVIVEVAARLWRWWQGEKDDQ
jgi:hypothetical protein